MTVRVDVEPELLLWAIERAGWDEETAERKAPYLDKWVDGVRRPTLKQLEKFASDTHTPFGLLFLQEPPIEELPIADMRSFGNAAIGRPSADLLETISICQTRQDWYHSFALANELGGPRFVGSATINTPPELVADQIRDLLGFNLDERAAFPSWEQARRALIDRIEDTGVLVMVSGIVGSNTYRTLDPTEFRGFALHDPLAPLIFINGADTKAAQIFTIIHEFAHIWLGHSALSDAAMTSALAPAEELWCNQVAAEVLVPCSALREQYRSDVSSQELERLARLYRVSTLVVLKRIFDAGFLTWDRYRERYEEEYARILNITKARRSDSGGGNFYYAHPLRISRQFAQAVISSTLDGSTSYRDAYRLLGTKMHATFISLANELGVS